MSKIIALDDGHGMETPGKRTPVLPDGSVMLENEFNRAVVKYLDENLKEYGFDTLLVAEGDTDVPLQIRTKLANNQIINKYNKQADFYISIHANANTAKWGSWGGIETYVYPGTDNFTKNAGAIIQKYLVQGTPLRNRGLKTADFYVLRETFMPAVLVECGFMDNLEEAMLLKSDDYRKECARELTQAICEIYNIKYTDSVQDKTKLTKIMGKPIATVEQLISYTLKNNAVPNLPYCSIEELARMFIDEGNVEGVRGDIAFSQAIKETGYFKYGGIVNADMNNYAGIGALNNNTNANAAKFETPQLGVKAQIQHLKAYASNEPLNNECIDPRFNLVKRNSAPYVEWLGAINNPNKTGWANPGEGYGEDIINILNNILKEPVLRDWQVNALTNLFEWGIIKDIEYWEQLNNTATLGDLIALNNATFERVKSILLKLQEQIL